MSYSPMSSLVPIGARLYQRCPDVYRNSEKSTTDFLMAKWHVRVIRWLGKNCILTNRDIPDVLRHIIKNDCSGISCPALVTQFRNFFFRQKDYLKSLLFSGCSLFWRNRGDGRERRNPRGHARHYEACRNWRGEACYSGAAVTKLSPVDAHKDKVAGWGATLKCVSYPGCCGKN